MVRITWTMSNASAASAILCSICLEHFRKDDRIYRTTCGHLFHLHCIQDCLLRSPECPECREKNVDIYKVFLNFDENEGERFAMNEVQAKLQICESKAEHLADQLNEAQNNFLQLQGQYTTAHVEINKLKDELSFCEDSEKNFMALQGQYTEVENEIRNLKERNTYLSLQVAAKSEKLQRIGDMKDFFSKGKSLLNLYKPITKDRKNHVQWYSIGGKCLGLNDSKFRFEALQS
uniref:RING-type domain-containing protein n=1 Tax=Glossina pallidipes TaxID=7398 RepID=A0A1A9ZJ29_GLOPL